MIKKILTNRWAPLIAASLIFTILQLKIFNLGLGFRDEGFLYLNAVRILSGEIPYRDFFMTTTPGSFYLIALFIKIFGNHLIIGRILYFPLVILCLFFVDVTHKFDQSKKYVLLISLGIIFLGNGAIGFYNLEALLFCLGAFYYLNKGLDDKNNLSILLAGLLIGIAFIFKQSYGFWVGFGIFLIILLSRFGRDMIKIISIYTAGGLIVLIPFAYYFYINNSFSQFLYYTTVFSREVKAHRTPFIIRSFIAIPVIYLAFKVLRTKLLKHFVAKNIITILIVSAVALGLFADKLFYYADLSRAYYAIFLIFPVFQFTLPKNKSSNLLMVRRTAVLLLFLFIANASSGRELGTVMWVAPAFFPLIIYVSEYLSQGSSLYRKKLITGISFFIIIFQAFYFSSNNINPNGFINDRSAKKTLVSELDIEKARGIKVLPDKKYELDLLLDKLSKYPRSQYILCFPYCPMLNVLADRKSPSYFNFFYSEAFLSSSQGKVIDDLKKNSTIVVLQKKGKIEPEALYEDRRLEKLKNYVLKNYKKEFETGNFTVYVEK